ILHPSIGKGWQNGIRSQVFLTAIVPAMIAVSTIAPFALRRPLARNSFATGAGNFPRHSALAARAVTALSATSTIAGRPAGDTCVRDFLRVGMVSRPPG